MEHTTYSFLDLSGSLSHSELGNYIFTGQGVGSVGITMTTEKTDQSVAADGVVMTSKIAGFNGQLSIECQQTSALHKWLLKSSAKLYDLPTSDWATMSATLRNLSDGTSHIISGIAFGKHPDKAYADKGAMVKWTLYAADIKSIAA